MKALTIVMLLALLIASVGDAKAQSRWVATDGPYGGSAECLVEGPDGILYGGGQGGVLRSTDDGVKWLPSGLSTEHVFDLIFTAGGDLVASTYSGLFRSSDGGRTWSATGVGLGEAKPFMLASGRERILYAGGNQDQFTRNARTTEGGFFRSTDDGRSWEYVAFAGDWITGICVTSVGTLLVVRGRPGEDHSWWLSRSTDGGRTWTDQIAIGGIEGGSLLVHTSGKIVLCQQEGGVGVSSDDGVTWTDPKKNPWPMPPLAQDSEGRIFSGSSDRYYWISHEVAGILRSDDGGISWTATSISWVHPAAMIVSRTGKVVASCQEGLATSSDLGAIWEPVFEGWTYPSTGYWSVLTVGPDGALYGGLEGGVFRTTDKGQSWEELTRDFTGSVMSLAVSGAGIMHAVSLNPKEGHPVLIRSTDDGRSWNRVALPQGGSAEEVFRASDGLLVASGFAEGYISTDRGETWEVREIPYGAGGRTVCEAASGTLMMGGYAGVSASTDRGATWVGRGLHQVVHHVARLASSRSGWVYATSYNHFWRSSDDGHVWEQTLFITNQRNIQAMCVDSAETVYLGTDQGVQYSTDHGSTWLAFEDPMPRYGRLPWHLDGQVLVLAADGSDLFAGEALSPVYRRAVPLVPVQINNTLQNASFETGTDPWIFHTDAAGSLSTNSPGASGSQHGRVEIDVPGQNVQLYQSGFSLISGAPYRLSFSARSATRSTMSLRVFANSGDYRPYGLDSWMVELGPEWKVYSREFLAEGFAGTTSNTCLRFWFGPYDGVGSVYDIDNVVLERADVDGQFVWEHVKNGRFDDGTHNWRFYTDAPGWFDDQAEGPASNNAAKIAIQAPGRNVQLYQTSIPLWHGRHYRLRFSAASSAGQNMGVYIHQSVSPYMNHGLQVSEVDLSETWKAYTYDFDATLEYEATGSAELRFWFAPFAQAGDEYYIDDVSLVQLDEGIHKEYQESESEVVPNQIILQQNYPNPFNPSTTIRYELPQRAHVVLTVFNMLGQKVTTPLDEVVGAGYHEVQFDASDLASGVYLYRLTAGDFIQTRKLVLVR